MPDLPNSSSFIPKRTAGTKIRQKRTRNFFLLSIVSYACLIAAPTASAAVYVYKMYTERQFDQLVTQLDEAIGGFSEAEMARVLEFDRRLGMAKKLVDSHVSVVKALAALEETTVEAAAFRSLDMKRLPDGMLSVEGELLATNFDTALFQRGAYTADAAAMSKAVLSDVAFSPATVEGESELVTLTGKFSFSSSDIAFSPVMSTEAPTQEATPESETSDSDADVTDSTTDAAIIDDTI